MLRKPRRQRDNPKARKVVAPPSGTDLAQVAAACHYVGSPYHKDRPSFAGGMPHHRPDASLCPGDLAKCRGRVEDWLREAVKAGRTGGWDGSFPRYVWHCEDDIVFEARHGGSGEYHGYPLEPWQHVWGLK